MQFIITVLPAPFGPMTEWISPFLILALMPSSAQTLPNDIQIPSSSRRTSPGFISFDTLNTQDLLLECDSLPLMPPQDTRKKQKKPHANRKSSGFPCSARRGIQKDYLSLAGLYSEGGCLSRIFIIFYCRGGCLSRIFTFLLSRRKCGVGKRIHFSAVGRSNVLPTSNLSIVIDKQGRSWYSRTAFEMVPLPCPACGRPLLLTP